MKIDLSLLYKYNQPVPRYTSYPTVPHWHSEIEIEKWKASVEKQFVLKNASEGISLYLYLPFCESLCTYCGCNKKITTNHSVEEQYLQAILEEWKLYLQLMPGMPIVKELHLGGGTPTFFSPGNLSKLVSSILDSCSLHPQKEFSIEGHPNNTSVEHLKVLYELGFRRISFGVQDNDPNVQRIINRIQPYQLLVEATKMARAVGFTSINFDLIYGLPLQTIESMEKTIEQCLDLKPDRVAFYSYAHVPWTSRGQRLFDENDLPAADLKMQLYLLGKNLFTSNGYYDIGMDHFALPSDDLYIASQEGRLHRNFMGYTTQSGGLLVGLGVSSISDTGEAFAQNKKTLQEYYQSIKRKELAVQKGYFLSGTDIDFRQYILDLICTGKTVFEARHAALLKSYVLPVLQKLEEDNLVELYENAVLVTPLGKHFLRNICSAFDLHLYRSKQEKMKQMYSKAI